MESFNIKTLNEIRDELNCKKLSIELDGFEDCNEFLEAVPVLEKIQQLEERLKEAEKVISFYADIKNYDRLGSPQHIEITPVGENRTTDHGSLARQYMEKV